VLRFTIADIEGELPVMALSDELSALADVILDVTLRGADVGSRGLALGRIPCRVLRRRYGKLGGKELGYGSDLDVIFLYDEASRRGRALARVAQRVNTWMTDAHAGGRALRDRPAAAARRRQGPHGELARRLPRVPAASARGPGSTRRSRRARACAGDRRVGARFEACATRSSPARDRAKLFGDIARCARDARRAPRDAHELKHVEAALSTSSSRPGAGARHGRRTELRENKGNHTLLHRAGSWAHRPALAGAAADAYLAMRRRAHQAALNDEEKWIRPGSSSRARAVRGLWKAVFSAREAGSAVARRRADQVEHLHPALALDLDRRAARRSGSGCAGAGGS
jgi:glutamate-ammonia-ligase adenylyltransferase